LTNAIHSLGESVPLRMRNGDARLLEVNAREIQQSAQGARFRQTQANEAVFALLSTLEMNLGKALEATSDMEEELAQVRVAVEGMGEGAGLETQKEAVLASLSRMSDANLISRSRVDQGVARVRELNHHIRTQSGDVGASTVRVTIDSLTQVADRIAFLEALPLALVEARHAGGMLTCMRLNVDGMKRINEDYHESSGDDVLRTVAATIIQQLRNEDFVARIKGDDFAALLPNTGNREATGAAKRLGRKVSKMIFTHQQRTFQVSIAIGIATWDGNESAESLYARADTALARAKKNGGAQYWASRTHQLG
jgi:diguanylate cyclase